MGESQARTRSINARLPFYGWAVVATTALASFCAGTGQPFVFSVFIDPILADTGLTRTDVSALYAFGTAVSAITIVLIGRLVDRFGGRWVLGTIAAALGTACFGMASITGALTLFLAFAALRILAQGTVITGTVLVAQWFVRYRGRAMTVVGLGFAGATALLPITSRFLIDQFGWRGAYMALGSMVWLLVLPPALGIVRDRPERIRLFPDGAGGPPDSETAVGSTDWPVRPAPVITSLNFWLLAVAIAIGSSVYVALIFHQASIFAEHGLGPGVAAAAFVPFALGTSAAMAVTGYVIDRFDPKRVMYVGLVVMVFPPLLAIVIGGGLSAIVYTALLGSAAGGQQVISRVAWAHFYGRLGLGRVQGPAMMVSVTFAALSPLLLAALQGATGNFRLGLIVLALAPLAAIVMVALFKPPLAAH